MKHILTFFICIIALSCWGANPSFRDLVWTNSNGTIKPVTGSTISNLVFNSSVTLSEAVGTPDTISIFKNNGTNTLMISSSGDFLMGPSTINVQGGYVGFLTAWHVPNNGEVNSADFIIGVGDSGGNGTSLTLLQETNKSDMIQLVDSRTMWEFWTSSPATSTPYTFNTFINHSGGNLMELKNNDTLKVSVDYSGKVTALNLVTPTNTPLSGQVLQSTSTSGDSKWGDLPLQSDIYATNIYVTNIYTTTIRGQSTIVSNVYTTNLYVTNLTVSGPSGAVVGQVLQATSTSGATTWAYVNQVSTNSNPVVPDFNLPVNYWQTNAAFLFLACANVDTTKLKYQVTDVIVTNSTAAAVLATFNGTVTVTGTPYITNLTKFHFSQYAQLWTNCSCEPIR